MVEILYFFISLYFFIMLLPYHDTVHTTERGSKLSVPLEEVTVHKLLLVDNFIEN